MKLALPTAQLYIPDNAPEADALARTTHLAIGAHQDDLEIMAVDGILEAFGQPDKWFTGVVMTNGAGSPRTGIYGDYSDGEMQVVRAQEQKKAAFIGNYAAQFLLDHPSSAIKNPANRAPVEDLIAILRATRPEIVYTHNPADKHDTHIGVMLKTLAAIRSLPKKERPCKFYGCEVWRDLDWMLDEDKVAFDVSRHENMQMALVSVFDSQVSGGKRYDLATMGRRRANATYYASHATDMADLMAFAMDLTPLIEKDDLDIEGYVRAHIERFARDVSGRLSRLR
ncbi:MAG: PIG-L family deacetylase [Clostridia bacterium]|nr:MAG: PIG-L family deacetylase [Clostridia bacterium]